MQPDEKLERDGVGGGDDVCGRWARGTHGRHRTDALPVISWLSRECSEVCRVSDSHFTDGNPEPQRNAVAPTRPRATCQYL